MEEKFNYVVGFFWSESDGHIAAYTYFGQVHYGTMKDAEDFLAYVKTQDSNNREYQIFKVELLTQREAASLRGNEFDERP